MWLQRISFVALIGVAIASGYGGISWAWMIIPAFFYASLNISNGPAYDAVMRANTEGRLSVFPIILACQMLVALLVGFLVRWLASLFS